MSAHLLATLGNPQWLSANDEKLRALLPKTWTHMENLNVLALGFGLKLLGVDWHSNSEFAKVMIFLEKYGLMQRDGMLVRANPDPVFPARRVFELGPGSSS